ncbi:SOCS domain-containing protein stops [Tachypleus tridentatus]|uniref:SOCS domain-containing protein stops n=1 Tax=Tachypleus tridentatus TaxID=6853 RepID=UPI003FCEECF2
MGINNSRPQNSEDGSADQVQIGQPLNNVPATDTLRLQDASPYNLMISKLKAVLHEQIPPVEEERKSRIRQMLNLFYQCQANYDVRTHKESFRRTIYLTAKFCYWWNIQDTGLVAEVLQAIFDHEGHLSVIFQETLDFPEPIRSLWQWNRPNRSCDIYGETGPIAYFLKKTTEARVLFGCKRLVDLELALPVRIAPASFAALYSKPKLLYLLITFGALIPPTRRSEDRVSVVDIWDEFHIPLILRHHLRTLWAHIGESLTCTSLTSFATSYFQDVINCIKLLLRTVPSIKRKSIEFNLFTYEDGRMINITCSLNFIQKLVETKVLPQLRRRYFEPPELQHLCRCILRRRLRDNWSLPSGITKLSLPVQLQSYMELLYD